MKVLIIVYVFPPKWIGGTELATYSIADALAQDHQVHVATSLDDGVKQSDSKNKFQVHRIRYPKIRFIWDIIFSLKVLKLAYGLKPDIVHAQGIGMGFTAMIIKKLLNINYVLWGRGSEVFTKSRFKKFGTKIELRNACAVISLTKRMEKTLLEIYNIKNSHVLPNGIDLSQVDSSKNNKVTRQQLKIPEKVPIITFVGNLRPVKGVKYLVEAISIVLENNNSILLVIGDGPEMENLKSLTNQLKIQENVIFAGRISKEEIMSYLQISNLFVLPSLSEGFPNVILEAMAAGLPIVTTNFEGSWEIVKDGENGFIVSVKNSHALARGITKILDNPDIKQAMSRKNREEIVKYDWNNIISELEEIYRECV